MLATSRQSLGITGEHVFPVPPLSAPSLPVDARELLQYEAVNLLVERAGVVAGGFTVTETNAAAVAGLCARLDGIPLAIELAATRLRTLSVEQLTERLVDRDRGGPVDGCLPALALVRRRLPRGRASLAGRRPRPAGASRHRPGQG